MKRILVLLTVVALRVVMLAMSVGPALAKTNDNFPIQKVPDQGDAAYSICVPVHSGHEPGAEHAAQC